MRASRVSGESIERRSPTERTPASHARREPDQDGPAYKQENKRCLHKVVVGRSPGRGVSINPCGPRDNENHPAEPSHQYSRSVRHATLTHTTSSRVGGKTAARALTLATEAARGEKVAMDPSATMMTIIHSNVVNSTRAFPPGNCPPFLMPRR